MSQSIKSGTVVDDRYKVVKRLGKGGQGEVYLVQDTVENNAERAMKTLHKGMLPKNLERMRREVSALRAVDSEFVLAIKSTNLDSYEQDCEEVPYFVTELARYGTLRRHNYFNGEIELSLRLFRDICKGVSAIHKEGVIHRDLKPSNILLVENERDVRIGDFGICYVDLEEDNERATEIREKVGPLFFAAPEQTSLPPNFTNKSDIYSLGRILYYLTTGVYKFIPGDEYIPVTVHLGMKVSHPVDDLTRRLISFDPKNRPGSVEEVIREVDQLLDSDQGESLLKLSKMQERIVKYLRSDPLKPATLTEILGYLANFYGVVRRPWTLADAFSAGLNWVGFAEKVENSLDQLEEAGMVSFERGEYRWR